MVNKYKNRDVANIRIQREIVGWPISPSLIFSPLWSTPNSPTLTVTGINQSGDSRLQALHAWRVSNAIGNALKEY